MKNEKNSTLSKRAKFNMASVAVACIIIALVIMVNLITAVVSTRINTKIDLTTNKILEFSPQTEAVIKGLKKDVKIYSLIPEEDENDMMIASVISVLKKYDQSSSKISFERIDTKRNPEFLQKIEDGTFDADDENASTRMRYTIVFECDGKYKSVILDEIINIRQSQDADYVYFLSAEQKFTSAIMRISNDNPVKFGLVQGHGEASAEKFNQDILFPAGYESVPVNLSSGEIDESIDILAIISPRKDFTSKEIETLDAYFDKGGKAQIILDFISEKLPVLEGYLGEWGLKTYNGYVVENNPNQYVGQSIYILPTIKDTTITKSIKDSNYMLFYPVARGIQYTPVPDVQFEEILTSSENSHIEELKDNAEDVNIIDGSSVVVGLLSRFAPDGKAELMVMAGSSVFAGSNFFKVDMPVANMDFYYNAVEVMTGNEAGVFVVPKNVTPAKLLLTGQQGWTIMIVTVVLMPLSILIAGLLVWIRRRHL